MNCSLNLSKVGTYFNEKSNLSKVESKCDNLLLKANSDAKFIQDFYFELLLSVDIQNTLFFIEINIKHKKARKSKPNLLPSNLTKLKKGVKILLLLLHN